ncbi:ThiF family adenylyltransferase [Dactylosporangium darangshiense]|uniref:ThiF family adenylyltransferase n=1 Tax=Dactylosporangium darangshiense TaxID=579108 RepID=UPI00363D663E
MPVRPRLKPIAVVRRPAEVILVGRAMQLTYLADPDGSVAALLQVLAQGAHPVAGLPAAMRERGFTVTEADMAAAVAALDEVGVLLRADTDAGLDPDTLRRHESNLRFYDLFAGLQRPGAAFHRAMRDADVLLLGAGGMGSGVLQSLVGLGAGRVRLVDFDVVEEKNLSRQFAYGRADVGRAKADAARDWAARYSPGTTAVEAVREQGGRRGHDPPAGRGRVRRGVRHRLPNDVHLLVNEACFELGVPFVTGGLQYSTLFYWSVEPGVSPCRLCLELNRADEGAAQQVEQTVMMSADFVNRATGPVAQLLAGFVALEAGRYLTRTDPPVAAATYHTFDLADAMRMTVEPWPHNPGCPLC